MIDLVRVGPGYTSMSVSTISSVPETRWTLVSYHLSFYFSPPVALTPHPLKTGGAGGPPRWFLSFLCRRLLLPQGRCMGATCDLLRTSATYGWTTPRGRTRRHGQLDPRKRPVSVCGPGVCRIQTFYPLIYGVFQRVCYSLPSITSFEVKRCGTTL